MIKVDQVSSDLSLILLNINRLDAYSAKSVKEKIQSLMNSGSEVLIVDFSFVEFIDSTGLGILISILKKMGSRARLILCNLQANVSSTFKLTRMDRVFEIYPTLEDAKSSVSNS